MAARNTLRRSLLYVPGSSQRFLDKSRSLAADCVAYDLEDSVTPHMKAEARGLVRRAIDQPTPTSIRERAVRINSVDSGLALGDLTEVLQSPNLTTIVIPKVNSASDLTFVTDVISHTLAQQPQFENRPPISLLALVESAKSLTNLTQICGLREFLFARSAIATAARAADLPSTIDLVCTTYKSEKGDGSPPAVLQEECLDGRRLGFNGKQCIHPSQVKVANDIFGPQEEETTWAVRCVIADDKAAAAGRGAWTLDGKMIDVPVAQKARAIVKKAEAVGVDVQALREQWKHQEPE
ncbi:hypothetical protein N7481_009766 [Penicillium waksmanii]|uniref:uncharacterized protein n=1 Tax=Penicillium waksmanii TaxID=69791 RepID=UPI0025475FE2|nr:uncharacterized protein N7481_009766 [Penicillium waksmanii]KAJ5976059.1 hypothetical protein N7481_009766 [Penicillium waksmanii]